jgi:hypothetical protein
MHELFEQLLMKDSLSFGVPDKDDNVNDGVHQRTKSALSKIKAPAKELKIKPPHNIKAIVCTHICDIKALISPTILQKARIITSPRQVPKSALGNKKQIPIFTEKLKRPLCATNSSVRHINKITQPVISRAKSVHRGSHIGIESILKDFEKDLKTCRPISQMRGNQESSKTKAKLIRLDMDCMKQQVLSSLSKCNSRQAFESSKKGKVRTQFHCLSSRYKL